jgi:hypothetical protein
MSLPRRSLFEVEWLGGVAEHHFRRVRAAPTDIHWESLQTTRYRPEALQGGQQVWTSIALSEYAAIASFAQVVRALVEAQAPLDLIGMTSDFLADEVKHVELACRVVMQLGGAAPRKFEPERLVPASDRTLSPFERANELALRIGCIAESFASATAVPIMRAATHPVVRDVYEAILRDEARHCRFGSLYFEWASEHWDDAERTRLAAVALTVLRGYARLVHPSGGAARPRTISDEEAIELGWFEPQRYEPLVHSVVVDSILPQLIALGLPVDAAAVIESFEAART